jgi:acetylornithine deacetylase/succinyl-diaminopimelate desuccinylase-like protein
MKSYLPTWALDKNHQLVKSATKSFQKLFDSDPVVDKWVFSTNGVATMGMFNIPTIGFGPGEEKVAHAPDEFIPIDHLAKAMAFYVEFVRNF